MSEAKMNDIPVIERVIVMAHMMAKEVAQREESADFETTLALGVAAHLAHVALMKQSSKPEYARRREVLERITKERGL